MPVPSVLLRETVRLPILHLDLHKDSRHIVHIATCLWLMTSKKKPTHDRSLQWLKVTVSKQKHSQTFQEAAYSKKSTLKPSFNRQVITSCVIGVSHWLRSPPAHAVGSQEHAVSCPAPQKPSDTSRFRWRTPAEYPHKPVWSHSKGPHPWEVAFNY